MKIQLLFINVTFCFLTLINCDETFNQLSQNIYTNLINVVQDLLRKANDNLGDSDISKQCRGILEERYLGNNKLVTKLFLSKLIRDSSKSRNEVSTYSECMRKVHGSKIIFNETQFTYIMASIDKRNNLTAIFNKEEGIPFLLFGLCVSEGCNEEDYRNIILKTMDVLNSTFGKEGYMKVYDLSENKQEWKFKLKNTVNLIPVFFILIQVIFSIWNVIPGFLFKCFWFYRQKKPIEGNSQKKKHSIKRSSNINFAKIAFNVSQNGEELFNLNSFPNVLKEDLGLSYIKGVKGMFMILMIFGNTFFGLNNTPLILKNNEEFLDNLSSLWFGFFYSGLKYSPRILLSCSGYSLLYKFMCFLDDQYEEEKEKFSSFLAWKECDYKQSEIFEDFFNCDLSDNVSFYESSLSSGEASRESFIKFKQLLQFLMYQIHKYFICILLIFFIQYSSYYVVLAFKDFGPMWGLFKKTILETTTNLELGISVFNIHGYFFPNSGLDSFLNYFWLVFNEILSFFITSIIIFLCYKKNWRLDRIFIISWLIIFSAKNSIYYLYIIYIENKQNTNPFTATDYLRYDKFGKFSGDFIFNYLYYILGCYFSMINYSLQKGYTYDRANSQGKHYLLVSIKISIILQKFTKNSKVLVYIISVFLFLVLICFFEINFFIFIILFIHKGDSKKLINEYYNSKWTGIILFYDTDVVILIIHCICLLFYYFGNTLLFSFLTIPLWTILDKIYFSFILLLSPTILYVLYQSETRITFTLINALLYSLICGVLTLISSSICYIVFELPYKKLIHFFFSIRFKRKNSKGKRM